MKHLLSLLEYNSDDSFLSDFKQARKYAYDNIDGVADSFDHFEENPDDGLAEHGVNHYDYLISSYNDKYLELADKDEVTIYRLVMLKSEQSLDINNIGSHWSFEEDGVGNYGGSNTEDDKSFILEAIANPKDIDWVYGFSSFIWYGEDQWECALNRNSKVKIISINDEERDIDAVVGIKY